MATTKTGRRVVARKSGSKGSTAKAKPAKATASKSSSNGGSRRSGVIDKIRKDVKSIAKKLRDGATMKSLKAEYNVSDDGPIRRELAKGGFDSKGGKLVIEKINAGNAAGRKQLVKERKSGTPWYILELATGKSESELRDIVEKAGGPTGRVYTKAEKAAKAEASRGR